MSSSTPPRNSASSTAFVQNLLRHTDVVAGLGLLVVVAMLILPMPKVLLDLGLVIVIAMSVLILLTSVNVSDPLEFSTFPSVLVLTTLFRLSLSIAATKMILGTGEAGQVIETFGNFVMGGDIVVGLVAFLILMIVQFVVITNGAERVSEVVARFMLDGLPGKQMAIDSDLAAGHIDEVTARERRKQVQNTADFYASMDGASKFVKGDAIAGILMVVVNIIGGFAMGAMRGEGDLVSVARDYAILSVGEGLVIQIPALLVSVATGLMVTRVGQDRGMGGQVALQMMHQPKAIGIAGVALAAMAFVPGFPTLIFLTIAGICFGAYRFLVRTPNVQALIDPRPKKAEAPAAPPAPAGPESVLPLLAVDTIEMEIGYALTRLADTRSGGDLPDRIIATRRQIATELGFVMPTVRMRDSTELESDEYVIKIRGEEVVRSRCLPDSLLALGTPMGSVPGVPTKDPIFGLDAIWIDPPMREHALASGCTVIDPSTVLSTHLSEIVKQYAPELLSRQDVAQLIDNAKQVNEAVVNELIPSVLGVADVQKVLQHLLRERVPIRDMVTILETMADFGSKVKDPDQLGELVRGAISRTITRQFVDHENRLYCVTLEPVLERKLVESVQTSSYGSTLVLDHELQSVLRERVQDALDQAVGRGYQAVLLCSAQLRLPLRRWLDRYVPTAQVLAYNEVAARAEVEFVGQVRAA